LIIQELVYLLRPMKYEEGTIIVKKGQSSDCIYFLKSGKIAVEQPLKNEEFMHVDTLEQGSCFSIYDAFHEEMRQKYDYKCKTHCTVEMITAAEIRQIELQYGELCDVLKLLRMQLEGIARSTPEVPGNVMMRDSYNGGFNALAKTSFHSLPIEEKPFKRSDSALPSSLATSKVVDFDYFRFASGSQVMQI